MSDVVKIGYGSINDNDSSLTSKVGGKFGLNTGRITKFEFDPNSGKDGTPGEAIQIVAQIGDRQYQNRLFETTKVYDGDGAEITDTGSEDYIKGFNKEINQQQAVVVHTLKAFGVTQETIDTALSGGFGSFSEWAEAACSLAPDGFESLPVDIFLEWQWSIKGDNEKTYLQLPKNLKGGRFLCVNVQGNFEPVSTGKGMKYVDSSNNTEHPFTRTTQFMESPKAYQQVEGEDNSAANANFAPGAASGQGNKSQW